MGVLDDAIREHLELKRRHGVAEEELRLQEEEALGPARREVAPEEGEDGADAATELDEDEAPAAPDDSALDEPEAAEADHPEVEAESTDDGPPAAEPVLEEHSPAEPALEEPAAEQAPALEQDEQPERVSEAPPADPDQTMPHAPVRFEDEHEHEHEHQHQDEHEHEDLGHDRSEPAPPPPLDTPPRGFEELEDDELLDEEGEPEGEDPDVLEDTPDFLQETPEHDRLWFEQKPPRDFDFD